MRPRRSFPGAFLLARVPVEPALEHAHVADIGAKHDVKGVARDRHQADHAVHRDIGEHPPRDVPGRPERTRLAHHHSEMAVVMMSPTTGISPISPSMP